MYLLEYGINDRSNIICNSYRMAYSKARYYGRIYSEGTDHRVRIARLSDMSMVWSATYTDGVMTTSTLVSKTGQLSFRAYVSSCITRGRDVFYKRDRTKRVSYIRCICMAKLMPPLLQHMS